MPQGRFSPHLLRHTTSLLTDARCPYRCRFGDYIWPALLVWGIDRFLRVSRILYNNRVWQGYNSNDYSHATVELLTSDTIRLTLRRKMHWRAGQHAYVVLPSVSALPTEAHPFTIASIPHALDGTDGPEEKEVVFLIRGRNGFTRRLRDHASQKISGSVAAYIDGPYGIPPNLKIYSTCVLIAGELGVKSCSLCIADKFVPKVVLVFHIRSPFLWISCSEFA